MHCPAGMEDDLYGDLVTSAGDVGAGLLKEKASADVKGGSHRRSYADLHGARGRVITSVERFGQVVLRARICGGSRVLHDYRVVDPSKPSLYTRQLTI